MVLLNGSPASQRETRIRSNCLHGTQCQDSETYVTRFSFVNSEDKTDAKGGSPKLYGFGPTNCSPGGHLYSFHVKCCIFIPDGQDNVIWALTEVDTLRCKLCRLYPETLLKMVGQLLYLGMDSNYPHLHIVYVSPSYRVR